MGGRVVCGWCVWVGTFTANFGLGEGVETFTTQLQFSNSYSQVCNVVWCVPTPLHIMTDFKFYWTLYVLDLNIRTNLRWPIQVWVLLLLNDYPVSFWWILERNLQQKQRSFVHHQLSYHASFATDHWPSSRVFGTLFLKRHITSEISSHPGYQKYETLTGVVGTNIDPREGGYSTLETRKNAMFSDKRKWPSRTEKNPLTSCANSKPSISSSLKLKRKWSHQSLCLDCSKEQ